MKEGSHFRAAGKHMFIERNFDESQFTSLCEQEAIDEHAAADEGKWVYQEVHWFSDKTPSHCSLDAAVRMLRLKVPHRMRLVVAQGLLLCCCLRISRL